MRFYDISILNVWHWDIDEHIKIRLIHPVQSDHYSLGDKSPIDLSGRLASKVLPKYQSARPKLSHAPALALLPGAGGAWKKSGKSPQSMAWCYCFSLVPNDSSQLFAVFYLDMGFHSWDGLWTRGSSCRKQGEPENPKDEADTCKPIFNVRLRSCVQWFCHLVSRPDIPKQHGRQQRTGHRSAGQGVT